MDNRIKSFEVFSKSSEKSTKFDTKHRILYCFERNYIKILRPLLLILRIMGISFGGLVLNSEGNISFNRIYRFYGYLILILCLTYDSYHIIFFVINSEKIYKKLESEKLPKILPLLLASIAMGWSVFKHACFYHFNVYGQEFVTILMKMMREQVHSMSNFKTILVLFVWVISIFHLTSYTTYSILISDNDLHQKVSMAGMCVMFIWFWKLASITYIISFAYCHTLDDMSKQLKKIINMRTGKFTKIYFLISDRLNNLGQNNFIRVREAQVMTKQLIQIKKRFVEMRNKINEMDTHLAYILVIRSVITMYSVMINIYILAIISSTPMMKIFAKILTISTDSAIVEVIISCLVCGLVHEKSDKIFAILDEFNANELSENEYKEWLMFKAVSREVWFGFTIGGFAPLRKTTLITVSSLLMKINFNQVL